MTGYFSRRLGSVSTVLLLGLQPLKYSTLKRFGGGGIGYTDSSLHPSHAVITQIFKLKAAELHVTSLVLIPFHHATLTLDTADCRQEVASEGGNSQSIITATSALNSTRRVRSRTRPLGMCAGSHRIHPCGPTCSGYWKRGASRGDYCWATEHHTIASNGDLRTTGSLP